MVKVAVAGGLGNLGKTITEVLHSDSKHEIVVLSRKVPENSEFRVVAVDYEDVDDLKTALEKNQVHTVISALMVMDETCGIAQINLIKAAAQSSPTKRFIASEYGIQYPPGAEKLLPYRVWRDGAVEELRKTDLEFTRIENGYFLDYYGIPFVKSYQKPFSFVVDMRNKAAAIPGTGDVPITFTYTYDIAKFVAATLDLPEWPDELFAIGDKLTWNEFVKLAEEACGAKFTVTYDDAEKLKRLEVTPLPHHKAADAVFPWEQMQYFAAIYGQWMDAGHFDLPEEGSLNQRFPEIKPMTVREMLGLWTGK